MDVAGTMLGRSQVLDKSLRSSTYFSQLDVLSCTGHVDGDVSSRRLCLSISHVAELT